MTRTIKNTLALILVVGYTISYAGITGKIQGTITDQDGQPLPGSNVMVLGTNRGAAADENGFYIGRIFENSPASNSKEISIFDSIISISDRDKKQLSVEKLNIENLDWILCYQSRVGPLKWIGPSTDEMIIKYSKEKKGIVIVPVAFVSEHSEPLVELDIEYKKLAEKNGCSFYKRVPALGVEKNFIKGLAELV